MRMRIVDLWVHWNDTVRIDAVMAEVVVADDMVKVHRLRDVAVLIELARICP